MNAPRAPADLALEHARFNTIEQQIRPWEVLDQSVLDLLSVVRREKFVPLELRALAFVDMEIPLKVDGADTGERMFSPKMEARFLQELGVKAHEHVLEVGTGSGYMAALLAHKAQHVLTVEIDERLVRFARANLARAGVGSVRVELGDGSRGWKADAPYDVIMVSGSLPALPDGLLSQLRIGGRLGVILGDSPVMSAQVITRVSEQGYDTLRLFETDVKPLRNAWRPSSFRF
jgi:protein-L-isoaspartate(D-aspartate) O-methyltransferase